jgi:hypothetical protein
MAAPAQLCIWVAAPRSRIAGLIRNKCDRSPFATIFQIWRDKLMIDHYTRKFNVGGREKAG